MRSTCELRTGVWTLSSGLPYNITTSKQANCSTSTRVSARIPTMNPIRALLDWNLMHFVPTLHTSLRLKSSILPQPVPGNRVILQPAGNVIGEVAGFEDEHRKLCADPWAPFNSAEGFKLASWFIDGKVSKTRINDYFLSGIGNAESVGYSYMHMLENHLRFLDPYSQYL